MLGPVPAPRRRASALVVAVVGAVVGAVLAGVGAWLLTRRPSGWFAYAQLSEQVYRPGAGSSAAGIACVVVGVLLVAGAGWLALRRR